MYMQTMFDSVASVAKSSKSPGLQFPPFPSYAFGQHLSTPTEVSFLTFAPEIQKPKFRSRVVS